MSCVTTDIPFRTIYVLDIVLFVYIYGTSATAYKTFI